MIKILSGGREIKNNEHRKPTCYCISYHCERSYPGLQGYMQGYWMAILQAFEKR